MASACEPPAAATPLATLLRPRHVLLRRPRHRLRRPWHPCWARTACSWGGSLAPALIITLTLTLTLYTLLLLSDAMQRPPRPRRPLSIPHRRRRVRRSAASHLVCVLACLLAYLLTHSLTHSLTYVRTYCTATGSCFGRPPEAQAPENAQRWRRRAESLALRTDLYSRN